MANDSRSLTYDQALERARRGAALLDEKRPGWREDVDLRSLDQASCSRCVLGQVFGRYAEGLRSLFNEDRIRRYPDDAPYGFDIDGEVGHYSVLTEAWREVLAS